jgi:RNA polymerase sigma-70 factor (ECF subfamily)
VTLLQEEPRLRARLAKARAKWPGIHLDEAVFVGHLTDVVADEDPAGLFETISHMHLEDLYLACACAQGHPEAIRAFEETYFDEIGRALKNRARDLSVPDVHQVIREKLFVAKDGDKPRIAGYTGAGRLRNWFRTTVVRTVLNLATRRPPESPVDDEFLQALVPAVDDPELSRIKSIVAAEVVKSIASALESLTDRERTLLRHRYLTRLSIDEVGRFYGVHRATAARWLNRAKAALGKALRKDLAGRFDASQSEIQSLVRLVQSRLEVPL